jgi:SPOR domain
MSGNYSPVNETTNPLGNARGSSTRLLLLVLLLVVAAAAYLYFFTDLIVPHQESGSPPPQTAQVKQPLPPRPGQPEAAKPGQAPAAPPAAAQQPGKPAPVTPEATAVPEKKPVPATPPVKAPPAKPAEAKAPAKPAASAAKAAKPAAPKGPAHPKPAVATTVPAGKKIPASAKTEKKGEKQAVKKKGGHFHLLVGDFAPGRSLAAVQAKLKKSGIAPVRKKVITAEEKMNRIFVARFTDQENAEAELHKVKKITGDAFLIADKEGYLLYAGSFLSPVGAAAEQKKLASRGVKSVIRKVKVPVRVMRVTAGSYERSEEAAKDATRLKKMGIRATVVKLK